MWLILILMWFLLVRLCAVAGNALPEPRKLLPIPVAAARLGIGRTKFYELIKSGAIPTVRIGPGRRLVPIEAVDEYADSLTREHSLERPEQARPNETDPRR
jgi:excisionase family DNA binding protein